MLEKLKSIAESLRAGAGADIWFDAREHGDTSAATVIECTQEAMEGAADMLDAQAGLVSALQRIGYDASLPAQDMPMVARRALESAGVPGESINLVAAVRDIIKASDANAGDSLANAIQAARRIIGE